MSENTPIQNETASVKSAPVGTEWSAPQVEALPVVGKTLLATNPGDDGSGIGTAS